MNSNARVLRFPEPKPIFQRGTYAIARLVPVELVEPPLSVVFRST